MNLSESAMLAGIIRGPNRFSPFRNYKDANIQRETVLRRMLERKKEFQSMNIRLQLTIRSLS